MFVGAAEGARVGDAEGANGLTDGGVVDKVTEGELVVVGVDDGISEKVIEGVEGGVAVIFEEGADFRNLLAFDDLFRLSFFFSRISLLLFAVFELIEDGELTELESLFIFEIESFELAMLEAVLLFELLVSEFFNELLLDTLLFWALGFDPFPILLLLLSFDLLLSLLLMPNSLVFSCNTATSPGSPAPSRNKTISKRVRMARLFSKSQIYESNLIECSTLGQIGAIIEDGWGAIGFERPRSRTLSAYKHPCRRLRL